MELLDRYLKSVRTYLPEAQADDIVNELRENIESQREDREWELGRPLTLEEQTALLKQHGSPLEVAGRYVPAQNTLAFGRQWIGPVLFPLYAKVLSINLAIAFSGVVLAVVALHVPSSQIVPVVLTQLLAQFAIITGIFCAAQGHWNRHPDQWLPDHQSSERTRDHVSRLESGTQLIVLPMVLVGLRAISELLSSIGTRTELNPAWAISCQLLAFLTMVGIAQSAINLIWPRWTLLCFAARSAMGLGWLAALAYLLAAGNASEYIYDSLLIAALISAPLIAFDLWTLARRTPVTARL